MSFDLVALMDADRGARVLSDLNLARHAAPLARDRLRFDSGSHRWHVATGPERWAPVDSARARVLLVERVLRDVDWWRETCADNKTPHLLDHLDKIENVFQSFRRVSAVLRFLQGFPEMRLGSPVSPEADADDFLAALEPAPGAFVLRAALYDAYAASVSRPLSRVAFGRLAEGHLGLPRKRQGEFGFPGFALPGSSASGA
jgi:hypothetical protein